MSVMLMYAEAQAAAVGIFLKGLAILLVAGAVGLAVYFFWKWVLALLALAVLGAILYLLYTGEVKRFVDYVRKYERE